MAAVRTLLYGKGMRHAMFLAALLSFGVALTGCVAAPDPAHHYITDHYHFEGRGLLAGH